MWGRMKSLECKYIDLANFYKKELLSQAGKNSAENDLSMKSAVGGVVQMTMADSYSGDSRSVIDTRLEDAMINELKNEKIRFE